MSSMTALKLFRSHLTRNVWRFTNAGQSVHRSKPTSEATLYSGVSIRHFTPNLNIDSRNKNTCVGKFEFQPQARVLLNIVAGSKYVEKEVFIRELISNASDALEKLRYLSMKENESRRNLGNLEINITTDKKNRTITIQDTGIGMDKEELMINLGTVAKSGSKAALEQMQGCDPKMVSTLMGKFGIGFLSCFLVADKVEVFTKSMNPDAIGYAWKSEGINVYEISEYNDVERGTKIVIHLKPEYHKYASEDAVRKVIYKYNNFVNAPIKLNGSVINTTKPLWLLSPKSVTKEQHDEFYSFVTSAYDRPRFVLHRSDRDPIQVCALLYFPDLAPGHFDFYNSPTKGISLYAKSILVKKDAENILPKWLRFIKGVIDLEDIPLNVSKEMMQSSPFLRKLNELLTDKIIKFLHNKSIKDVDEYAKFYQNFGVFIKEGIMSSKSIMEQQGLARLLRYESSFTKSGETTSFEEYVKIIQECQNVVYYISAPNRSLAENSPYIEAFKKKNVEIIYCYEPHDELILHRVKMFENFEFISVEKEIYRANNQGSETIEYGTDSLSQLQLDSLLPWIQKVLGNKVSIVKATGLLQNHPCMITVYDMTAARHYIKTQLKQIDEEKLSLILQPQFQLNPKHSFIKKLHSLKDSNEKVAKLMVEQLYSNSMIAAGLITDSRRLLPDINCLLQLILEKY